jgi:hypothetical protein
MRFVASITDGVLFLCVGLIRHGHCGAAEATLKNKSGKRPPSRKQMIDFLTKRPRVNTGPLADFSLMA